MTSQINPATIDGNYPIAGVPNNTQGMRDNFTAIKTNFEYAETEIDELQSKAVLKAALTGTTLDNNMANNLISNARIQGFSGTLVQIANTTGAITVDCSAAHYQTITMGGNISISFTTATWPAAGSVGIVRLQITVDTASRTMTLPAQVSLGTTGIQGYSANVITFAAAGVYEFGFLTYDQGTTITLFDYNRPLNYYTNSVTIAASTASTTTTTGALIVSGGTGIAGNVNAAGNVTGGNVLSGAVISAVGSARILSGTAVPAGGTTGAGYRMSSTTNLGIFFGSGAPTLSAAQGSLYLRTDGSSTTTRMYVNTNGTTGWTNVVTST
jgi:hypothetical protein